MTDITELAQSLKAAAEKATRGPWITFDDDWSDGEDAVVTNEVRDDGCISPIAVIKWGGSESEDDSPYYAEQRANAEFITLASPANVRLLVEELEKIRKAANINNQWKPDICPITGRKFFMWIEHPELGYVPTYGGPFDSYTIPTLGENDEFECERYDHDRGNWWGCELLGLHLVDDEELCDVDDLKSRIAELESRAVTVKLPKEQVDEADLFTWGTIAVPFDTVKEACAVVGVRVEVE